MKVSNFEHSSNSNNFHTEECYLVVHGGQFLDHFCFQPPWCQLGSIQLEHHPFPSDFSVHVKLNCRKFTHGCFFVGIKLFHCMVHCITLSNHFLILPHQESPTKELVEHGFPLASEGSSSGRKSQERRNISDDSSDGNISEESECVYRFAFICS